MNWLFWLLLFIVIVAAGLEIGSRILYRRRFRMRFHAKVVGEYPYRSFIEKVDPPVHFKFKKGFRSREVNINRLGLRGPEPAPDGEKKRMLVIGESNIFGAKLRLEKDLWSIVLEKRLAETGRSDWEVLNGGNPAYNSFQHLALWREELATIRPDILVVSLGMNDLTQAWVMGSTWKPGAPWPFEFILALERKSPWWRKILGYSAFYFLLRRRFKGPSRSFTAHDDKFQQDACMEAILENYRTFVEEARKMGAKVAFSGVVMAYDVAEDEDDEKRLCAIQSNWKEFQDFQAPFEAALKKHVSEDLSAELDVPYLDITKYFAEYAAPMECYYDLAHVNEKGMALYASGYCEEIDRLGWWDDSGK